MRSTLRVRVRVRVHIFRMGRIRTFIEKGRYGDTRSTHSSQEKLLFSEYMFEAMVLAEVSVRSHVESIYSTCTLQQFQLDCEIASKS